VGGGCASGNAFETMKLIPDSFAWCPETTGKAMRRRRRSPAAADPS
jgi:hypothetical protein